MRNRRERFLPVRESTDSPGFPSRLPRAPWAMVTSCGAQEPLTQAFTNADMKKGEDSQMTSPSGYLQTPSASGTRADATPADVIRNRFDPKRNTRDMSRFHPMCIQ